jgi:hypothetical protein
VSAITTLLLTGADSFAYRVDLSFLHQHNLWLPAGHMVFDEKDNIWLSRAPGKKWPQLYMWKRKTLPDDT